MDMTNTENARIVDIMAILLLSRNEVKMTGKEKHEFLEKISTIKEEIKGLFMEQSIKRDLRHVSNSTKLKIIILILEDLEEVNKEDL